MELNLHALPNEKDYRFGGTTRIDRVVYQSDRDWTPYLPPYEPQSTLGFDTWGCVAYSLLNCIETLEKRLYGSQRNNSDRFLVVGSGTVPNGGNSMSAVAEWNRTHGTIEEALYPFVKTQSEYYQPLPTNLLVKGVQDLQENTYQYEWVYTRDQMSANVDMQAEIWEALSYAPLQVSLKFDSVSNGVYTGYTGQANHVVMLFKGVKNQYWEIFDHYDKTIKRLAWDFNFGAVMRHHVIRKNYVPIQDLEGKIIKGEKPEVYLVENGQKRHFQDEISLWTNGRTIADVVAVPQSTIEALPVGPQIGLGSAIKPQAMKEMLNVFDLEPERAKLLFNKYF